MKTMLTKNEWEQALNAIEQMNPIELKQLHIKQTKLAMRQFPEMAEQMAPILDKYRNELLTLKLEAAK
jgi:hypothetical protein